MSEKVDLAEAFDEISDKCYLPDSLICRDPEGKMYLDRRGMETFALMLDGHLSDGQDSASKYIRSARLDMISAIEAYCLEKVEARAMDKSLNSYDLYEDIQMIAAIHQVHMESMSLGQKMMRKRMC